MSTSSYLAKFNVTIEQASQYVQAHMHDLQAIVATARQYGITHDMLGEIAGHNAGAHYSGAEVRGYLASLGIESASLAADPLFPSDMLQFSSVMGLNTVTTGALSTASLRAQVIARTSATAYDAAFDPNQYAGGLDGVFSAADLGVDLGNLPATAETLESLFYGTIIRLAGAVDMQEMMEVQGFVHDHAAGLANDDPAVTSALVTLMLGVVQDQATVPAISGDVLAQVAVGSAVALVGIASQHDQSLFDELLSGFVL